MIGMLAAAKRSVVLAKNCQMDLAGKPLEHVVLTHEQWHALVTDSLSLTHMDHMLKPYTTPKFMGLEVHRAKIGEHVECDLLTTLDLRTPGDWKRPAVKAAKAAKKAAALNITYSGGKNYYTVTTGTSTTTTTVWANVSAFVA